MENSPQENLVFKNNKKIKICNRIAIRQGNKRNFSLKENNLKWGEEINLNGLIQGNLIFIKQYKYHSSNFVRFFEKDYLLIQFWKN